MVVLERLGHVGGAAVSADLVSLLPDQIVSDLGLDISLVSRSTASYTPTVRDGKPGGLLVERIEGDPTRQSFRELTGTDEEYDAWRMFYTDVAHLGWAVAPTLLRATAAREPDPVPGQRGDLERHRRRRRWAR